MLVLTRKTQEKIQIGDSITITILKVHGRSVKVGIEAPRDVRVVRAELPLESAGRSPMSNDDHAQSEKPDLLHSTQAPDRTPWNPGEAATYVEMEAEFHFESKDRHLIGYARFWFREVTTYFSLSQLKISMQTFDQTYVL